MGENGIGVKCMWKFMEEMEFRLWGKMAGPQIKKNKRSNHLWELGPLNVFGDMIYCMINRFLCLSSILC